MKFILFIQNLIMGVSILLLGFMPLFSRMFGMDISTKGSLYALSFAAVFAVMIIRPLADITNWPSFRRLVILRKSFGILSASIIIGFMIDALIVPQSPYLASIFTLRYFSFDRFVFFAHMGDVSGLILLLTSNTFSQKLFRQNWKRIQRLSYVYFFSGGIYEAFALESTFALYAMLLVINLTVLAWAVKAYRRGDRAEPSLAGALAS